MLNFIHIILHNYLFLLSRLQEVKILLSTLIHAVALQFFEVTRPFENAYLFANTTEELSLPTHLNEKSKVKNLIEIAAYVLAYKVCVSNNSHN